MAWPKVRRLTVFALIGAGIFLLGTVAASTILFTQSLPSVPAGTVTPGCSNLQVWGSLPAGGGMAVFNCTSDLGAFEVNVATTVTPTFTLPTKAVDLYAFPATLGVGSGTGSCNALSGAMALTSGSSVSFSAKGSWEYCVDATGGFSGFSVSWSQ